MLQAGIPGITWTHWDQKSLTGKFLNQINHTSAELLHYVGVAISSYLGSINLILFNVMKSACDACDSCDKVVDIVDFDKCLKLQCYVWLKKHSCSMD